MTKDPILTFLPYLTPWFVTPKMELLTVTPEEDTVLNALSEGWTSETPKHVLIRELSDANGEKTVFAVLDKVVDAHIAAEWKEMAANSPTNTIDDILRLLWETLIPLGFEYTSERTDNRTVMHCTKCPYVQLGEIFGCKDILYHLACRGDKALTEGFNPSIEFARTYTLMEGADHCDHTYTMKEGL